MTRSKIISFAVAILLTSQVKMQCGNQIFDLTTNEQCDTDSPGCVNCKIQPGYTCLNEVQPLTGVGLESICTTNCYTTRNGQNPYDGQGCTGTVTDSDYICSNYAEPGYEEEFACYQVGEDADNFEPMDYVDDSTECQKFVQNFYLTQDEAAYDVPSIDPITEKCNSIPICNNGDTNKPCSWQRKLAVSCRIEDDQDVGEYTLIRVQTNSLPDHCFYSNTKFPYENLIDFEVRFNTPASKLRTFDISTATQALDINCNNAWAADGNLKKVYFKSHSGNTNKIVGIALNGVPIYSGISELFYDAFYPQAYGQRVIPRSPPFDACLGSASYTDYYHYYSFSPCIVESTIKFYNAAKTCNETCQNFTTYMVSEWAKDNSLIRNIPIGIAKDGHKIMSPFKADGKLWQPCDVDACNGVTLGNSYVYVATLFHPYTVGCWGPSTQNKWMATCSSRDLVCLSSGSNMLQSLSIFGVLFAMVQVVLNF